LEKSANKKWKESGSSLSFKEWIDRENKKKESEGNFIPFVSEPQNVAKQVIDTTLSQSKSQIEKTVGYKTPDKADKTKFLGLDKRILFLSPVIVVGAVGFYLYKKSRK
jgi:hypothetical protein